MHKKFAREGFTLIELTLSILFISILSLAVALLITNAITAYHRGIALSQINNVGMEVVDDMRMSIQNSQAQSFKKECASFYENDSSKISKCESNEGKKFSYYVKTADGVSGVGDKVPIFGAFCTGSYSYIWNSGYLFNSDYGLTDEKASLEYYNKYGVTQTSSNFKLLKVFDEDRLVCKNIVENNYDNNNLDHSTFTTGRTKIEEDPVDILTADISLSFYDLSLSMATNDSSAVNNNLYSVSFILGTDQGGVNIKASGNHCTAPEDSERDDFFDYCSINKFNFVAQANGGTNVNK